VLAEREVREVEVSKPDLGSPPLLQRSLGRLPDSHRVVTEPLGGIRAVLCPRPGGARPGPRVTENQSRGSSQPDGRPLRSIRCLGNCAAAELTSIHLLLDEME
jgi:hypothetical protein